MDIEMVKMISRMAGERHRLGVALNTINEVIAHLSKAREALDGARSIETKLLLYSIIGVCNSAYAAQESISQCIEELKEVQDDAII